jgi:membrane associated rhomboid family serine protease
MFMHASWMHIIGNMVFLWAFGPAIEDAMGQARFLFFYLAGGVTAMLAQILADPHSAIPCLGASGAIAAVMGAFIVTFPRNRIRALIFFLIFFRVTYIPAVFLIGFWFLMQVLNFGIVADVRTGGVAYIAHIAGFIFGAITARVFDNPRRIAFSGPTYQ